MGDNKTDGSLALEYHAGHTPRMRPVECALAQHMRSCAMMLTSSSCWRPAVLQDLDLGYVRDLQVTSDQLDDTPFQKKVAARVTSSPG